MLPRILTTVIVFAAITVCSLSTVVVIGDDSQRRPCSAADADSLANCDRRLL